MQLDDYVEFVGTVVSTIDNEEDKSNIISDYSFFKFTNNK